jgi:hypothetical protein
MPTQDKQFSGPVEVTEVNGPDIKAIDDFGAQQVKKQATANARRYAILRRPTRTRC